MVFELYLDSFPLYTPLWGTHTYDCACSSTCYRTRGSTWATKHQMIPTSIQLTCELFHTWLSNRFVCPKARCLLKTNGTVKLGDKGTLRELHFAATNIFPLGPGENKEIFSYSHTLKGSAPFFLFFFWGIRHPAFRSVALGLLLLTC